MSIRIVDPKSAKYDKVLEEFDVTCDCVGSDETCPVLRFSHWQWDDWGSIDVYVLPSIQPARFLDRIVAAFKYAIWGKMPYGTTLSLEANTIPVLIDRLQKMYYNLLAEKEKENENDDTGKSSESQESIGG